MKYPPKPPRHRDPRQLLFRFSALTYNSHRIHYDRDYARDAEGYPGLVVHGPLQAIAMAEAVRRDRPTTADGASFSYRLVAPVFDYEGLSITVSHDDARTSTARTASGTGRSSATGTFIR